ncbi:MAG TPA: hypothetical protein VIE43_23005 [Thermoanaerobaculia bacterium]|nr:hypothetical protein [Thermoanaerobaculia bacterium]
MPLLEDEDPVTFSRGRLLRQGGRRDGTAAVSLGAPTTAAAAGLGAATKLTTPGLLGKLGVLVGGAGLGAAGGIVGLIFAWLPRVTARRRAAELAADPTAARRHQRERRFQIFGAVMGLLVGAALVIWAILQQSGR